MKSMLVLTVLVVAGLMSSSCKSSDRTDRTPVQKVTQIAVPGSVKPTEAHNIVVPVSVKPTESRVFNAKLFLKELDGCIRNLKIGKNTGPNCGSFTDWVEPSIIDLRIAGISKKQIEMRLDQIFRLAKQKKVFLQLLKRG